MADIVETIHIGDLVPDPQNSRKRTERSAGLISKSLEENGFGRSILIDGDNRIVAGHGTVDGASELGLTKVVVVETDGNEVVAIRRKNLSPLQARRLSYFDNRCSELSAWVPEVIKVDLEQAPAILEGLFTERELKRITSEPLALGVGATTEVTAVKKTACCPNCGHSFQPI